MVWEEEELMTAAEQQYWIEPGETGRMGLEPGYAESLEGDWVGIELAAAGTTVRIGESFGFVTTHSRTYDLRAPFTFRVVAVNEAAVKNPALVRLSPMGGGWLMEIHRVDKAVV